MATEVKVNKFALTILIALGVMVSIYIISKTKRNYAEQNIKLSQLISASINLVERAGRRVAEVREMDNSEIGQISKGLTKEGKNEYVTAGDKVKGRKFVGPWAGIYEAIGPGPRST